MCRARSDANWDTSTVSNSDTSAIGNPNAHPDTAAASQRGVVGEG